MSTKFYVGQKDYIAKLNEIDDLLQGVQGEPGQGVPVGGTVGQVLSKSGEADYATAWVAPPSSGREILTASLTYYVRKDGSDGNTGLTDTPGGAFLTIQRAVNAMAAWDFGSKPSINGEIHIGDGTYEENITIGPLVGFYGVSDFGWEAVSIVGNVATPANVVIYPPAGAYYGIRSSGAGSNWYVTGIHLNATRIANYAVAIQAAKKSYLSLGAHKLTLWGGITGYYASDPGSTVEAAEYAAVTIAGACRTVAACDSGAYFNLQVGTLTLIGLSTSGSFLYAYGLANLIFYRVTLVGASTGKRFAVEALGRISTYGSGLTHVPGSIAGTVEAGGVYA